MSNGLDDVAKSMGVTRPTAEAIGRCLRELRKLTEEERLDAIAILAKCHCEPDLRRVAFPR